MNFKDIDILELLPQIPPFIMIDTLIHYDDDITTTRTRISDDNIFTENGYFTSAGMLENIAQTCAARIGYINKYILKKTIDIGFIGAMRNLKIYAHPAAGDIIVTSIKKIEEVFGMTLVEATIHNGDRLLAEGSMKISVRHAT